MTSHDMNGGTYEALLRRIERSRLAFLAWIALAGVVELGALAGFVLLADWSDRLHQLLAVMSLLIYGTLGLFMTGMLFYVRYWILRVLKAIDLLATENAADP